MMNNFYILGLPRSRTLWFANLFTFPGTVSAHEYFSIHNEKREKLSCIRGYVDTNPLITPDYGSDPVLIIERPLKDVIQSCIAAFDKPSGISCWETTVTNYMNVYWEALQKVNPANCMRVAYHEINQKLSSIWSFLLPDITIDKERIESFKDKIFKTDNRTLETNLIHTFESIENFSIQYDKPKLYPFRITDYSTVQSIMSLTWDEISEDNADPYIPDLITEYWIGLHNNQEVIGCYRFHQINNATWEGHVFMLLNHRKRYSKIGGKTILKWVNDHLIGQLGCKKIIVKVPIKYPNVMRFLKFLNFTEEGVNRKSYTKDGQLWDIQCYGMTDRELQEQL